MSIKFGSIIIVMVAMFVAKISIENFNTAEAREVSLSRIK